MPLAHKKAALWQFLQQADAAQAAYKAVAMPLLCSDIQAYSTGNTMQQLQSSTKWGDMTMLSSGNGIDHMAEQIVILQTSMTSYHRLLNSSTHIAGRNIALSCAVHLLM